LVGESMPSQSDSHRLLREHLALQAETEAILQDHKTLALKPFDAAAHRAHHERLATQTALTPACREILPRYAGDASGNAASREAARLNCKHAPGPDSGGFPAESPLTSVK